MDPEHKREPEPVPRGLWRTVFASGQDVRPPGGGHRATLAWQNAYAERVIGSIRRECLDHVVVLGERHLREILAKYVASYNRTRTHLSLTKDAPEPRTVQRPSGRRPARWWASL